jgi:hypothetical protein
MTDILTDLKKLDTSKLIANRLKVPSLIQRAIEEIETLRKATKVNKSVKAEIVEEANHGLQDNDTDN